MNKEGNRSRRRLALLGASVAGLVLAGSPAYATQGSEAGTLGQDAQISIPGATGSFKAGAGTSGEWIWICDTGADGHEATSYLVWGTSGRAQVTDWTGANGDCVNFGDLGIAEGTRVALKVCVNNVRCSGWEPGIA